MTREEIVEGLKLLEDNMVHFDELENDSGEWIDVHELLFEAIQALSQQPCEKCEVGNPCLYCKHEFSQSDTSIEQEPCTDAVSRKPNCIDCIHKSVCFRLDMRVDSDYAEKCGDFLTELLSVNPQSCDVISREDMLIDLANAIENDDSGWWTNKRILSALRNISSVTQKPIECDDAISRDAGKKWICKTCPDDSECQRDCDVIKGIDALPPVTPQQKYGKWILTIEDWNKWTCSKCGYVKRTDIHVNIGWKFCPNCGCRMVEPQESEDKE